MISRLRVVLKSLIQLGPIPVGLLGIYRLGIRTGYYRRGGEGADLPAATAILPVLPLPSQESLLHILGADGKAQLVAQADEIMNGAFRPFGGEPRPLRLTFEVPLHHWTVYESDPRQLTPFYDDFHDPKHVWEPARFGWAFILGRAYHATGAEHYAEAFWMRFEQFSDGNAAYLGPHWMNGQEVAIRAMALMWCAQVFAPSAHSSPPRMLRLARSVAEHARRIEQTLIYARAQNNNHLLTEAVALLTAGAALEHPKWRAVGWRWLTWAVEHQVDGYGEYIQHSTNYHRLMLQTVLWVTAVLNFTGDQWPAAAAQSLARAAHWLFSMLDSTSGSAPNLGANDGALLLPLSVSPHGDFRPTIQAAARAFLRTQLPPGPWDELSLWLGLEERGSTRQSDDYLADNLRGRRSWAYLRTSQSRSRLGHMDQLHLDLWWRGLNVAQDAGTFLYNADPPWDNPLVATRVHNTVCVDGREQMTRGGRFLALDWFPAYSRTVIDHDNRVTKKIEAWHSGYRGVRHVRQVSVHSDDSWRVIDRLTSKSAHTYWLHWLLPDWGLQVETDERKLKLTLESPFGPVLIRVQAGEGQLNPVGHSIVRAGKIVHGDRDVRPYEGWFSPTYGQKAPALSVACELRAPSGASFETDFVFPQ